VNIHNVAECGKEGYDVDRRIRSKGRSQVGRVEKGSPGRRGRSRVLFVAGLLGDYRGTMILADKPLSIKSKKNYKKKKKKKKKKKSTDFQLLPCCVLAGGEGGREAGRWRGCCGGGGRGKGGLFEKGEGNMHRVFVRRIGHGGNEVGEEEKKGAAERDVMRIG